MSAYYNEIEPDAVATLHELMRLDLIAPGHIDSRSIKEVMPDDLDGFTQCHFFAGAGIWSVAARLAGWPDARPLWTGSCPCQPFSVAGKGGGADDPRHLWPDLFRLWRAKRPAVLVGEQVAGSAGYAWFDGIAADMAGEGVEARAVDIPACAVDAPHIRQRLYWAAMDDTESKRRGEGIPEPEVWGGRSAFASADASGVTLGDAKRAGLEGFGGDGPDRAGRPEPHRSTTAADGGHMGDTPSHGWEQGQQAASIEGHGDKPPAAHGGELAHTEIIGGQSRLRQDGAEQDWPFTANGFGRNGSFWAGAEWITCHDGKARRTEPSIRLLVDGMAGRIGLWRLAGNSISPVLAAEVLGALQ